MIRIFVNTKLTVGETVELDDQAVHHLVAVLRQRVGASVCAFNGRGGEYACVIDAQSRRSATLRVIEHSPVERESALEITLAQGISRGERMDFAIQKAVELGVHQVMPFTAARSTVRLSPDRAARRLEHWRGIVRHACEQCGRNQLPRINDIQSLQTIIDADRTQTRIVLNPEGIDEISQRDPKPKSLLLVIGPEGGLDEAELKQLKSADFINLRLGPRILRTETATVAGISVLQSRFGDLHSST